MDIIQQLLKLVSINTRISSLHSSDEIMGQIMDEAMSLTGTTSAFVLRAAPDRTVSLLSRWRAGAEGAETSWSTSSALEAHDGQRLVYSTRALESSSAPSIVMGSIQTLISAPLSSGPDGTVVLQLAGRDATSIDPQTISLLGLFIGQVQVTTAKTRLEEEARRNAALAATGELAAQVAHDIRSPLAALEAAAAPDATEEQRKLLPSVARRIREIADELLAKDRAASRLKAAPRAQPLAPLAEQVVAEKRARHAARAGVRLESALGDVSARVDAADFKRLLSNLLDNAFEAVGERGSVRVSLEARGGRAVLAVKDDGKGIAPEVLARLGRRGETHGKDGGSGLGLHHARTRAEEWGGSLSIDSEPGAGTTVEASLPLAAASAGLGAVLIDDDALTRMTWRLSAERAGRTLRAFSTVAEFVAAADGLDKATPVYLDSDLADGVKGELEAARVRALGFAEVYLATGHAPEKFAGNAHLRGVVGKSPPWEPRD